jgi:hypothetical protein
MNNKMGLSCVIKHNSAISAISASIFSYSLRCRTLSFDILGAICFTEEGHDQVISSIGGMAKSEIIPYYCIVECLDTVKMSRLFENIDVENDIGFMDRVVELHTSCLTFINALMFNGKCKDLQYRLYLYNFFYAAGISQAIKVTSCQYNLILVNII